MEWNHYLNQVLCEEDCLDGIKISFRNKTAEIPPIVKVSVFLLEKMIKNQGRYNLMVFPGGEEILYCFMLAKLIYNIKLGKINADYSPESFVEGQKLKIGNAIVEFIRIDEKGEKKQIFLKAADCNIFCDLNYAPFFQTVDTKRRLSKYKSYKLAKKELDETIHNNILDRLIGMRTHMMGSLYYISGISKSRRFADQVLIDGNPIYEYFLVGQTDYTGSVHNIKGKYTGTHSVVFSSQISQMIEAVNSGEVAQSAVINISECDINNQLDALDDLIGCKIPVVCITDTINSFDIDELKRRGFNIWRWDERSINGLLCRQNTFYSDKKAICCRNQKIHYHESDDRVINKAFSILYGYRKRIEEENQTVNRLFSRLFSMAYEALRSVIKLEYQEIQNNRAKLNLCSFELEKEAPFMNEQMTKDFQEVIDLLRKTNEIDYDYPKRDLVKDIIKESNDNLVVIICSNNDDAARIEKEFWGFCNGLNKELKVIRVRDYLNQKETSLRFAIITGWISSKVIRKIIYGYSIFNIHITLYDCENQWKNAHSKYWRIKLNSENNEVVKNKSFLIDRKSLEIDQKNKKDADYSLSSNEKEIISEKDDAEYVLQENRYRKYTSVRNNTEGSLVEAMPVSYVGGDFSLYTKGHRVLVASNIIMQVDNKVEEREVESIKIGDFVVIRESSKDIIRDVADLVLKKNNKEGLRDIASIWKESLKIESMISSSKEIRDRLKDVGCKRSIQTIRNWMYSDNIIIPQTIDDLEAIYLITDDVILHERIQEVFDAGSYIKKAHIKAGRILSDKLSETISLRLSGDNAIDPYNVWEPIEVDMEDIGLVRIYKVTDVGDRWLYVRPNDTNRILSEEKDMELWQE